MNTIIKKPGFGELIEKKSKFLSEVYHIDSAEEAEHYIANTKHTHYAAKHWVYAYIADNGAKIKYSDDGEPQGTAGRPLLDLLRNMNLTNCIIIVTRYFGGVLLGTGGLVRAYTESAKLALENSEVAVYTDGVNIYADVEYSNLEEFKYKINQLNTMLVNELYADNNEIQITSGNGKSLKILRITSIEYTNMCRIHLVCTNEAKDIFISEIRESFAGRIDLDMGDSGLTELIYE